MKRPLTGVLCAALLLLLTGCYVGTPEPVWQETYTGERKAEESITVQGVTYTVFTDGTAEATGVDPEQFTGSVLRLPEVVEDHPVTAVTNGAFAGLSIAAAELPEGLVSIGKDAFRQSSVTSVQLPDSLTEIGEAAFSECTLLEEVRFGTGLKALPADLFAGCVSLKEALLPEALVSVGEDCFFRCKALRRVTLPETLRRIDPFAFASAGGAELSFAIPAEVAEIGAGAFRGTAWLDGKAEEFVIVGDGVLIRYNGESDTVTVPAGIKYLSDAFSGTAVKSVVIPAGVRECENAWEETRVEEIIRTDG